MKNKSISIFMCSCLFVLLLVPPSNATGPSYTEIKIIPIASNTKGCVIFKTKLHINKSGRHSLAGLEYGWLCASSNGIWEEQLYYRLTENDLENISKINLYETEFEKRTNLENPSVSLKKLMDKYDFKKWETLAPYTGKGKAVWSLKNICIEGTCLNHSVKQRSLMGLSNDIAEGKPVTSVFFHKGLILFENYNYFNTDEQVGAYFPIGNILQGKDIGFDIYIITGISIIELQ